MSWLFPYSALHACLVASSFFVWRAVLAIPPFPSFCLDVLSKKRSVDVEFLPNSWSKYQTYTLFSLSFSTRIGVQWFSSDSSNERIQSSRLLLEIRHWPQRSCTRSNKEFSQIRSRERRYYGRATHDCAHGGYKPYRHNRSFTTHSPLIRFFVSVSRENLSSPLFSLWKLWHGAVSTV